MRITAVSIFLVTLVAYVLSGCQSVKTTSAKLRNQEGNYDLAIQLAKEAIAQNPNDAEAYFQMGVSYSHLDSVGLAYESFTKAMRLDSKKSRMVNDNIKHNFAKHYNLGQKAFNRGDIEAAAREFQLATEADPRQAIGFYNFGVSLSRLGDEKGDSTYWEKALAAQDRVLELSTPADKHYVDALKSAGHVLAKLGRVDEAESRFQRLVEEDPTNYGVIENLGNDMMKAGDWKSAAVFLDLAARARAKIDAEDFDLYYNLGVVNYKLQDEDPEAPRRAIEYYKKALDLQPDEPQTILNIVYAAYTLEDWREAISWGERYVALVPDGERGWQILSIAYNKLGDEEKARQCAIKFEEIMQMKGKAE